MVIVNYLYKESIFLKKTIFHSLLKLYHCKVILN